MIKLEELEGSLDKAAIQLTEWEEKESGWKNDRRKLEEEVEELKVSHSMAADAMGKKIAEEKDKVVYWLAEAKFINEVVS